MEIEIKNISLYTDLPDFIGIEIYECIISNSVKIRGQHLITEIWKHIKITIRRPVRRPHFIIHTILSTQNSELNLGPYDKDVKFVLYKYNNNEEINTNRNSIEYIFLIRIGLRKKF